jgi:hypothetical protein
MLPVALVVLMILSLSHWGVEPLLVLLTPVLNLSWLGWAGLAILLWLFAGSPQDSDRF